MPHDPRIEDSCRFGRPLPNQLGKEKACRKLDKAYHLDKTWVGWLARSRLARCNMPREHAFGTLSVTYLLETFGSAGVVQPVERACFVSKRKAIWKLCTISEQP